jgi:hypothetical protein
MVDIAGSKNDADIARTWTEREKLVFLALMAAKEIDWSHILNTDEEIDQC